MLLKKQENPNHVLSVLFTQMKPEKYTGAQIYSDGDVLT